jgi:hypothetical protein
MVDLARSANLGPDGPSGLARNRRDIIFHVPLATSAPNLRERCAVKVSFKTTNKYYD